MPRCALRGSIILFGIVVVRVAPVISAVAVCSHSGALCRAGLAGGCRLICTPAQCEASDAAASVHYTTSCGAQCNQVACKSRTRGAMDTAAALRFVRCQPFVRQISKPVSFVTKGNR